MADEFYSLPGEPVYHEKIRRIQNNDPVNAEEVLNPVIQALLDNAHFARLLAEALAAQNAADHTAIRQETTEAIAAIPTPDVSGQIGTHDASAAAHSDIRGALENHQDDKSNPHGTTAAQVGARPDTWTPTAADVGASPVGHKHTKDEIIDFPTSMPASDVPAWAKEASKPSYMANEVGARPSTWTPSAADVGAVGLDLAGNADVPGILTVGGLPVHTVGMPASNPNLLINSYFADIYAIINQRGQTQYTGPSAGRCIDCWVSNYASDIVELTEDGLKLTTSTKWGSIKQTIENYVIKPGITYTISILYEGSFDGLRAVMQYAPSSGLFNVQIPISEGWNLFSKTFVYNTVTVPPFAVMNYGTSAGSIYLAAAKLELGSVQTLAHKDASGNWVLNDPPPNKTLELLKCQEYQVVYSGNGMIGNAHAYTETLAYTSIVLPVKMRIVPTIKVAGNEIYLLTSSYVDNSKKIIEVYNPKICNNVLTFTSKVSGGLTPNTDYNVYLASGMIIIDSNL